MNENPLDGKANHKSYEYLSSILSLANIYYLRLLALLLNSFLSTWF